MNLGLNSAGWRTWVKSWCSNCFTVSGPASKLPASWYVLDFHSSVSSDWADTEQVSLKAAELLMLLQRLWSFCSLTTSFCYFLTKTSARGSETAGIHCFLQPFLLRASAGDTWSGPAGGEMHTMQSLQPSASQGLWEIITYTDKRYQGCESNACKSWSILAARIWMPLLPVNVAPIQMTDCHLNLALTSFIYCMRFMLWFEERSIDFLTGFSVVFII